MADAAGAEVGITIRATDRTSPGFVSAAKGADGLEKKFATFQNTVKAIPERMSKVQGALMSMGGALGEGGGKAAEFGSKIAGLGAMLATGGPIGIGFAAATLVVSAFVSVLDKLNHTGKVAAMTMDEVNQKLAEQGLDPLFIGHKKLNELIKQNEGEYKTWVEQYTAGIDAQVSASDKLREMHLKVAEAARKRRDEEDQRTQAAMEGNQKLNTDFKKLLEDMDKEDEEASESKMQHEADLRAFKMEMADSEYEYQKELDEQKAERAKQVAATIEKVSSHLTAALIADSEEGRNAAVKAAVSAAMDQIQAAAAAGAADAAKGAIKQFPYPYNLVVAAVASAAVYTAIAAFRAKVIHAATGGLLRGGVQGRDSIDVRAMPGELIVRAPVVQEVERRLLSGGPGGAGGGSGLNVFVDVGGVHALHPSSVSQRDLRKIGNAIGTEVVRQQNAGFIKPPRR